MDIRESLAKRIGDGITWRAAAPSATDDDGLNRRSNDALQELAGYVMTLSPTDGRLQAMAELELREDSFTGTEDEVDKLIAGYGTNRHLQSHPDSFLDAVVGVVDGRGRVRPAPAGPASV